MRNVLGICACVFAITSCGKKEDGDGAAAKPAAPAAGAPSTPAAPASPKPAPAPAGTGVGKLACAKLIPGPLVEKYAAGLDLQERRQGETHISCNFQKKQPMEIFNVAFECKPSVYAAMDGAINMLLDQKGSMAKQKGARVPGIGKGAATIMNGQLVFWASNAHCMVTIVAMGEAAKAKDVNGFAKELDAALTPASIE